MADNRLKPGSTDPLIILHLDKRANFCRQVNTGPVLLVSIL